MKEVIFKLPDEVLTLIVHKVANTPQEASLLEKWIYDGEERKTGKWIVKGNKCVCSSCGSDDEYNLLEYRYCPYCGTKMEVEDADSN
jgi:DNA-directed RNA polymerase subunit RPC12/RpoP